MKNELEREQPRVNQQDAAGNATWVEHVTAGALCAVIAALGWIVLVAYKPDALRLVSLATEICLILILLVLALALVSVVALLHTRR